MKRNGVLYRLRWSGLVRRLLHVTRHPAEAIRMPIARWLDRRHPQACWADLCTWAMGWKTDESLREIATSSGRCAADADRNGTCWCGKQRNEARMRELGYESPEEAEAPQLPAAVRRGLAHAERRLLFGDPNARAPEGVIET